MYARYTEYLRDLMLNEQTAQALNEALSTYPIYTPQRLIDMIPTREELNQKLLNHYKYREIGFETVGRFLDELKITMCEIMPRYNELFKTVEIMADLPSPFDNVDVIEEFTQETTNTATNTGNTTQKTESGGKATGKSDTQTNSKNLDADTPQDTISIGTKDIDSVDYASSAGWNEGITTGTDERTTEDTSESSGSSSGSSESSGTLKHTFTKKGNQGVNTYAHDMNEFRTSIIDIVDEIINDYRIAELFMMVY